MRDFLLTPEAALERQIELYRDMSGKERPRIALDLHALSREGIGRQFPDADEDEADRRLRQRIEASRG